MRWGLILMAISMLAAHGGEEPGLEACAGIDGNLRLTEAGKPLCRFECGVFDSKWAQAAAMAGANAPTGAPVPLRIKTPSGVLLAGEANFDAPKPGTVHARYTFTTEADVQLNALHVTASCPIAELAGKPWKADDKQGTFPAELDKVRCPPVRSRNSNWRRPADPN